MTGVVVVGAGQAGFQLALSLREGGYADPVTLVGDEPGVPYQRPPLSKAYLAGTADAGSLAFRFQTFFADHRIALRAGRRAVAVDRAGRRLHLDDGEALPYAHLVFATGARNRRLPVPGGEAPGVLQLRDLAEAESLRNVLAAARRLVVVGAGFVGLEVAAVCAARGLDVTVIEAADRIMARAVSPALSAYVLAAHVGAGVAFALGAVVDRVVVADGRAAGVETRDGRVFPADALLVGIGVVPNDALAAQAGLAVADGIVVDERLATADPAISAIGDCARHPSRFAPGTVRIESVQNAVEQARCLAGRLLGHPAVYGAVPWFWSDQGPLKLQIAGLAVPGDDAVVRGSEGGALSVFRYRGARLVAVETANRPADHMIARRLLAADAHPSPDAVRDPAFDLKGFSAQAIQGQATQRQATQGRAIQGQP